MKGKNKWIIVGVVAIVLIIFGSSAASAFLNLGLHCSLAPFDDACTCESEETKFGIWTLGGQGYMWGCTIFEGSGAPNLPLDSFQEFTTFVIDDVDISGFEGVHCPPPYSFNYPIEGNIPHEPGDKFHLQQRCADVSTNPPQVLTLFELDAWSDTSCVIMRYCDENLAADLGWTCAEDLPFDLQSTYCPLQT